MDSSHLCSKQEFSTLKNIASVEIIHRNPLAVHLNVCVEVQMSLQLKNFETILMFFYFSLSQIMAMNDGTKKIKIKIDLTGLKTFNPPPPKKKKTLW